jgi:hypothetical protein
MLVNVFSNTTPPRVNTAEGVSIVGLALSLSFMAAIVALAFVACAGLYKHSLVGRITWTR